MGKNDEEKMTGHPDTVGDDSSPGPPAMVARLFEDVASIERAYLAVVSRGYDRDDVNVVMSDEVRQRHFSDGIRVSDDLGSKAAEGGELGGPMGGTIGTMLPVLVAVGALIALPAIGLAFAGPVAAALAGAGAAGVAGGLIGLASDWGIPEERVHAYEAAIRKGGILMAVTPRSDEDAKYFEREWEAIGGKSARA